MVGADVVQNVFEAILTASQKAAGLDGINGRIVARGPLRGEQDADDFRFTLKYFFAQFWSVIVSAAQAITTALLMS
jgi:hypothetical protein